MHRQSRISTLPTALAAAFLIAQSPLAEEPPQQQGRVWDVSLGAGVAYAPTYEGGDNYTATPLPYISIKYKDRFALGIGGLTADLWKNDTTTLGVGLTYDPGRDENGDTVFGSGNDRELEGMGDIDGAAGAKVYASHELDSFVLKGNVIRYMGDDNDGMLADAAVSRPINLSKKFRLIPSIAATWADGAYMETFFGVDARQAADSRFPRYDADAGFKDIAAGVRAIYNIDQQWSVTVAGQVKQLLDDAADSPITADETSYSLLSTIAYRF